jgi:hypothetical protein
MSYDDQYNINPKDISLSQDGLFLKELEFFYQTLIDIYKNGINNSRKKISDILANSANTDYLEDEFYFLDKLENDDNHFFNCFTIVSMYSKCEIFLKRWLQYLNVNIQNSNISTIKKGYGGKGIEIELESINNYDYFNSLRIANNCIKHNDAVFDKKCSCREKINCLDFYSINKKFQVNDKIVFEFSDIVCLADQISVFLLEILSKIIDRYSTP